MAKKARVPRGTPALKSWYVERQRVKDDVIKGLTAGSAPRMVALVGESGSGKTTVASNIVRNDQLREFFSDGVLWLTVGRGANASHVMQQLAVAVHEDVRESVGSLPTDADGQAYVKRQIVDGSLGGGGLRCLVVADNVWDEEVSSPTVTGSGDWL